MKATADAVDLEAAIDKLYQAPLDGFTAARNALAAALRKAGRRAEADRVKSLAKPAATAWAVNRVWWHEAGAVDAVLEAGAVERGAHMAFAEGRAADVRAAAAARARAVTAVVEAAVRALGRSTGGLADARFRIAGTVEALASGGLPADVAPGRLTRDLQSSGLDALSGPGGWTAVTPPGPRLGPVLVPSPRTAHPREPDLARTEVAARRRAEHLAQLEARTASAEAALQALSLEERAKGAALEQAQAAYTASARQVADLERQLDGARASVAAARRALSEATKSAGEAEVHRARAAREVARARAELADHSAPGGARNR